MNSIGKFIFCILVIFVVVVLFCIEKDDLKIDMVSEYKLNSVEQNNFNDLSSNYPLCYDFLNVEDVYMVNDNVENSGVIYLTFDDGPSNTDSTERILDILEKEGVKATFFVTKNGSDDILKREYEEGHVIALHSYFHRYSYIYSSVDAYFSDLEMIRNRVRTVIGEDVKLVRFPGGSNNTVSNKYNKGIMKTLREQVIARGYVYFDWNVDSGDAWSCSKSSVKDKKSCVYENVVKMIKRNQENVVLLHDIKSYTADALEEIIAYAKGEGYVFDVISESTKLVRFK